MVKLSSISMKISLLFYLLAHVKSFLNNGVKTNLIRKRCYNDYSINMQDNIKIDNEQQSLLKSPMHEYKQSYLKSTSIFFYSLATAYGYGITSTVTNAAVQSISSRPFLYSVEMTDPPCLQPRTAKGEESSLQKLSDSDLILFGLHTTSPKDENDIVFTSKILERIISKKPRKAIVLAISDIPFNNINLNALQSYIKSATTTADDDNDMQAINRLLTILSGSDNTLAVELMRWIPLFRIAKKYKLQIIPTGIPSNVLSIIEAKGIQGLSDDLKGTYVIDRDGFLKSVTGEGFKRYSNKVIIPNYLKSSSLNNLTTPENYFSSKIIQHEFAASIAAKYANENNLVAVIAPEVDVKYGYGIQERIKRNLDYLRFSSLPSNNIDSVSSENNPRPEPSDTDSKVYSILVNPTAEDSLSDTVQLRLVLAYGPFLKYQRPLADYLWFSEYPSVSILTRPKNPINREGDKPAGESSIIGAF